MGVEPRTRSSRKRRRPNAQRRPLRRWRAIDAHPPIGGDPKGSSLSALRQERAAFVSQNPTNVGGGGGVNTTLMKPELSNSGQFCITMFCQASIMGAPSAPSTIT